MTQLKQSKRDYWTDLGDGLGPVHVLYRELVPADHPLVAANPDNYEDAKHSTRFAVEQATAAPGEKRTGVRRGRPPKTPPAGEGAVT